MEWNDASVEPENSREILLCFANGDVQIGYYREAKCRYEYFGDIEIQPEYWMDIPKTPFGND